MGDAAGWLAQLPDPLPLQLAMFPTTDNPAQRLLEILKDAAKRPDGEGISTVWGTVFGMSSATTVDLYRMFSHLHELADAVEFRIRQLESLNHDLYLRDIPSLRRVFSPESFSVAWSNYSAPLKHGALTSLEFCANELQRVHAEERIKSEEIEALKKRVHILYQAVAKSDLDSDLKAILFDLITAIRLALDNYRIKGADGLRKAVVYSVGLLSLHKTRFAKDREAPTIQDVFKFVSDFVTIIKTAYKLKELGAGVVELIGGPSA